MYATQKADFLVNRIEYELNGDINEQNRKDLAIFICDVVIQSFIDAMDDKDVNYNLHIRYWQSVKDCIK